MSAREPHGAFYDGSVYARLVDPLSARLRDLIGQAVPEGSSMLDACCGTGALALHCAPRCSSVLGVDLSQRMISFADEERERREQTNVRFEVADASALDVDDGSFDVSTIVMALHEMPAEVRLAVVRELARVADTLVVVDFAPSMPWNPSGVRFRAMELMAGRRHFGGFRDFRRRGGLPPLIEEAGLTVLRHGRADGGNLDIYTLAADPTSGRAAAVAGA